MPLYEEKLICPFAVRFSQERVRPFFKDGTELEASCAQITTRPGVAGYDIILTCPFPSVEIVRWTSRQHQVASDSSGSDDALEGDLQELWFTFDNRRLYCLQRAAAAHWPKRCAAVVQVMYADNGTMTKKEDTRDNGRSVFVGRAKDEHEAHSIWDWRTAVLGSANHKEQVDEATKRAMDLVACDERKNTVDMLQSMEEGDAVTRLMRHLEACALAEEKIQAEKTTQARLETCTSGQGRKVAAGRRHVRDSAGSGLHTRRRPKFVMA